MSYFVVFELDETSGKKSYWKTNVYNVTQNLHFG